MRSMPLLGLSLMVFLVASAAEGKSASASTWATAAARQPPPTTVPIAVIQGIVWQWSGLVETLPASLSVVPNPANYTITFAANGTVSIRADCNMVAGSYMSAGISLTITLGPSTAAFCGEESLDRQYLALLGQVAAFGLDGNQLLLLLKDGAGQMSFTSGGLAPSPAP